MSYPPPSDFTVPPPNVGIPPPNVGIPPPAAAPVVPLPAVPPPFYTRSNAAVSLPPLYQPPPTAATNTPFPTPPALPVHYRPSAADVYSAPPPYGVPELPPPPYYSLSRYEPSRSHGSEDRPSQSYRESRFIYSPSRQERYERERECRERYYESCRSRSPHRSHHPYSRSPSRHSIRSPSRHHSPRSSRHHSSRSPSRHHLSRSPSRHYSSRSLSRHYSCRRSPSRRGDSKEEQLRKYYEERKRKHAMKRKLMEEPVPKLKASDTRPSPTRSQSRSTHDDREHRRSPPRRTCRSPNRETHRSLHSHRSISPRHRYERNSKKPLTDREKILEEYRLVSIYTGFQSITLTIT